jgi:hypothetical protein
MLATNRDAAPSTTRLPMRVHDIRWVDHLEEAQALARTLQRPIAIKVLGQGTDLHDNW